MGFRYYYKFENRKTTARVQINYCATIYFMNKNINCEEGCDKVVELDALEIAIQKVKDEITRRKSDERTMKLKEPRGFVSGLEWAVNTLEEKP